MSLGLEGEHPSLEKAAIAATAIGIATALPPLAERIRDIVINRREERERRQDLLIRDHDISQRSGEAGIVVENTIVRFEPTPSPIH